MATWPIARCSAARRASRLMATCSLELSVVEKIRMSVPFPEAVASNLPSKDRAMHDKAVLCASTNFVRRTSYSSTLTWWKASLAGQCATCECFGSKHSGNRLASQRLLQTACLSSTEIHFCLCIARLPGDNQPGKGPHTLGCRRLVLDLQDLD